MKTNQKIGVNIKDDNIIRQLWFKYSPYWPLIILFLLLSLAGAWMYLRYETTALYEATASILLKDEKKGGDDSKISESLDQLSEKKIIENEIEIIRSKSLMTDVVKKLHLYAPIFEQGKIGPISAYETSPVTIESINPDSLIETDKVFFSFDVSKKKIIINDKSYPLNEWVNTQYGILKFIPQKIQRTSENPLYFYLSQPKNVAINLADILDVTPVGKLATIINLEILDESPKRAEDILNGLVSAYNNAGVYEKNTLAAHTLAFLDERLKIVGHDLDSIEQRLQQYKSSRNAIDISSQGNMFLENVNSNDQKLSDVNLQLSVLDQVEKYVKSKDNAGGIGLSIAGLNDPLLSQLLEKLYDSELQYERLKKTTAENNPLIVSINNEIEKIKPSVLENIHNQRLNLEANKNNLNTTNNLYSSVLQTIPQKERDLVEISRQQNIKSSIYNFLLQKREETALSLSSSGADSRIVDKAQASFGPVSPKKKMIYAMAVILSLVISIGLITANDMFKRTILYRQEIETYTSAPVIGEIAYQKGKDPLAIGNGRRTFIAEQFRNLRTTLPYIGLNGERKKILVTSTVAGEGKSFIVVNLGMGLAMAGKKVAVLEFDLSDPTLCKKLDVTTIGKGLTDYLSNQAEAEDIIQRTQAHENLFIIPAGWLPENPSELILSEKVPELLKYLSGIFDYIIIDSAPVGLLSDAYVLSGYCDATFYIVRHRLTRKVSIQRLDEINKITELKNMAIIFNGVRSRGFGKNGYGYGYGYGYIYQEGKKRKKGFLKEKVS